ncbi:MAG: hypothetical protein IJ557_08080 [Bacteroidaceae bacterium]|nr:hypothetical protein [Bacteroidaceae bacterium]
MRKQALILLTIISTSLYADSTHYEWGSLPVGGGGFVSGIITTETDDTLIYARTDVGGVYRWIGSTQTWKPITDWISESQCGLMGIESMAIDPQHPNKLYIYAGTSYFSGGMSAILVSDDYGDTFSIQATVTSQFPAHGNDGGRQSGERLVVSPVDGDVLFCGSRTRGVWRSTNGGKTWRRVGTTAFPDNRKVAFVQFLPTQSGDEQPSMLVGLLYKNGTNLYRSDDGGDTWTAVDDARTDYMPHRCTVGTDVAYITYTDAEGPGTNGKGGIMKLDLQNGEWTDVSPTGESYGEVQISPSNAQWLVACSMSLWQYQPWRTGATTWGDQIYVSRNGGKTWTNIMTKARFSEPTVTWLKASAQLHWCGSVKIDRSTSGRTFFVSGNGIFITENVFASTPSFKMAVNGLEETVPQSIVSVAGAPLLTTIGDYDGFMYDTPTSRSTRYTPSMGTTACITVAGEDVGRMVRVGSRIYQTKNGGRSWSEVTGPLADVSYSHCALSASGNMLIVSPNGHSPYFTTDDGNIWTQITTIPSGTRIYPDYHTDGRFYALHSGRLYVYTYDPDTRQFAARFTAMSNGVSRLAVVSDRTGEVLVARGTSGIIRVTTGADGTLKSQVIQVSSATCIGVGHAPAEGAYPAIFIWGRPSGTMPVGIYRSDDEGASWVRVNDDLNQFGGPGNAQIISGDMNVYGRVYMSTVGRGIVYGEMVTDVADDISTPRTDRNNNSTHSIYTLSGIKTPNSHQSSTPQIYIRDGKKTLIR